MKKARVSVSSSTASQGELECNADQESELSYLEAVSISARLLYDILAGADRERRAKEQQREHPSVKTRSLSEKVLAAIEKHGPRSPRELRATLGCSSMTLSRTLRKLINARRLSSTGSTRNLRYDLTIPRGIAGGYKSAIA